MRPLSPEQIEEINQRLHITRVSYTADLRVWMNDHGHYLNNAPPGALFAVGVYAAVPGLFPGYTMPSGPIQGLCIVGRPVARMLAQDGTVGEITRLYLVKGLPKGTASTVLQYAADLARSRGMVALISYHDTEKHTGMIYQLARFRKDGITTPHLEGWASRPDRDQSATAGQSIKQRWRLTL